MRERIVSLDAIQDAYNNNPGKSQKEMSEMLGVSMRTLRRRRKEMVDTKLKYDIPEIVALVEEYSKGSENITQSELLRQIKGKTDKADGMSRSALVTLARNKGIDISKDRHVSWNNVFKNMKVNK